MSGGTRPGSGRKPITIDLDEVEKLCAIQCTDEELAAWFRVSVSTIERRKRQATFADAMARGKAKGKTSVRRHLFGLAAKGNVAAAIFLAKNVLGYRDVMANEHSGPGGAPIAVAGRTDLSTLSRDDLEQLRSILAKAKPGSRS